MSDKSLGVNSARRLVEPELIDVLNEFKKNIFASLNCHAIGTVLLFDPLKKTAQVQINYLRKLPDSSIPKEYPVLMDCPVMFLSGGIARLSMPVTVGDQCLVLFNDRDMDMWWQTGMGVLPPTTARKHSMSDAVALVGINNLVTASTWIYDPLRASLKYGEFGGEVAVSAAFVKIGNAVTTLKTVLNGLIDLIKTQYTIPTVPGAPATLDPVVIAQLEAYKLIIGSLLE